MFREALAPLAAHRRREGLTAVVSTEPAERALAALPRRPACIVLVGDEQAARDGSATKRAASAKEDPPWRVPSPRKPFYRWMETQRRTFAADAAFGDLDGDGVPDVPVGRLPVRTADELRLVIDKIIRYERRPVGADDLRLPIWSGSAMYGEVLDRLAAGLLVSTLDRKAPPWVQPWVMIAEPSHPLAGVLAEQPGAMLDQVRRGGLMTLLIGHADRTSFQAALAPGLAKGRPTTIELTAERAARELAGGQAASPMVILACSTGDFAGEGPCLAEALLLARGGPVAVIAATTESHPLPNAYTGRAMLEQFSQGYRRLGSWLLAAQRQAATMRDVVLELALLDVEGKLDERLDVARLQRDQLLLYAILGDPATRIRLPQPMDLAVEPAGRGWRWRATPPSTEAKVIDVSLRPLESTVPVDSPALRSPAASAPGPASAPAIAPASGPTSLPGAERLRDLHRQANAGWTFHPLPLPAGAAAWQGEVDREGVLRVLAAEGEKLYVGTARLERPKASP